jgi:hypothetical protein
VLGVTSQFTLICSYCKETHSTEIAKADKAQESALLVKKLSTDAKDSYI